MKHSQLKILLIEFLFNWGVYYEFFYNARIGMSTLTSIDNEDAKNFKLDNQSSADFSRRITYRFFLLRPFFVGGLELKLILHYANLGKEHDFIRNKSSATIG